MQYSHTHVYYMCLLYVVYSAVVHVHVYSYAALFFHREGTGFYRKLQGSVSRLRKRAEDVCEARQRERQALER